MNYTAINYVQFHDTFFLGGKNFGKVIDEEKKKYNTTMFYDEDKRELKVWYAGEFKRVPYSNIRDMKPVTPEPLPEGSFTAHVATKVVTNMPVKGRIKAQASSPTDHVFADAPGKTRD